MHLKLSQDPICSWLMYNAFLENILGKILMLIIILRDSERVIELGQFTVSWCISNNLQCLTKNLKGLTKFEVLVRVKHN